MCAAAPCRRSIPPQLDRRWSLHLRRSPNRGRRQQPVIWVNQVVGTTHVVNNETGDHIACNAFGKPIPPFHPGVSGVANTKERLELELKVRPARARRPAQGRKPASLVFVAWPADVPCVCGMVAGREMGEVAAEKGAAEATAAGAGAAAGARVNHRPIRWEDAGRDRPAPEQGIYTGPGSQQPMRPPTTPEAPPARTGLPSGWAGRAYRSGGDAGCGGALTPAHRRRPRSLRTAQVSEGEGAIAAAVSRARGEADSPCGVLVEMSTQPRLPASEALTRSPTPRHPLHPSTDPANTARGRCEGHAYDGLLSVAGCSFLIYPSRRCDSRRWRRRGTR